jgi:centromere protein C
MLIYLSGTIPEPTAVLAERKSMRLPPRSKSPIKTFLQSPARRNQSLGPVTSPTRGSIVAPRATSVSASVRRKLDFSKDNMDATDESVTSGSPEKRAAALNPRTKTSKLTNGTRLSAAKRSLEPESGGEDNRYDTANTHILENGDYSYRLMNSDDEGEVETRVEEHNKLEEELESEAGPQPVKKTAGKGKKAKAKEPEVTDDAVKGSRGRPAQQSITRDEDERPAKRARTSEAAKLALKNRGGRPKGSTTAKGAGGRSKLATISEADSPEVQRAPPMPRNNRGLFILRRETPMEGTGFKQTRSGRNSIKPVSWWKNEKIEYEEEEIEDGNAKFLLPRIKEVVRKDEVDQPKRPRPANTKARKARRRATVEPESLEEDDEEEEPWESEPGRVVGEIRSWDPEDQVGSQAQEREEEIALSSAAIITRDIAGATFRFAKTLTLPFFGSGMVDLPPGAVKKPKNSRKMQMVFFVYYGRVQVTVNDNVFRIGKGGMWQVPRGNLLP